MEMALSSMVLISSQVSSCTKPTWFASMKQGSHIMLQRLVRSMVSTHLGQSESVERGQPSGGLVFSQDFNTGLSDHLGVKEGAGLMLFARAKTAQAPLAARVKTFSAYLTGLCMVACSLLRLIWR